MRKIVFIHGFAASKSFWADWVFKYFEKEEAIILDLPGHGDKRHGLAGRNISEWVTELEKEIPVGSVLVGWSLGGLVAISIAEKRKDIKKVITLSSDPYFAEGRFLKLVYSFLHATKDSVKNTDLKHKKICLKKLPKLKSYLRSVSIVLKADLNNTVIGAKNYELIMVAGTRDRLLDLKKLKKIDRNKSAKLEIVPGGHFLFRESPALIAGLVKVNL